MKNTPVPSEAPTKNYQYLVVNTQLFSERVRRQRERAAQRKECQLQLFEITEKENVAYKNQLPYQSKSPGEPQFGDAELDLARIALFCLPSLNPFLLCADCVSLCILPHCINFCKTRGKRCKTVYFLLRCFRMLFWNFFCPVEIFRSRLMSSLMRIYASWASRKGNDFLECAIGRTLRCEVRDDARRNARAE
jgi:hypothetical protein